MRGSEESEAPGGEWRMEGGGGERGGGRCLAGRKALINSSYSPDPRD